MNRVVVTGMGVISPLGNTVEEFQKNLYAGTCGVEPITRFDTTDYKVKVAAEVKDFDPSAYMSKAEEGRYDLYIKFAIAAAEQAVQDSHILPLADGGRTGVSFGSAIGGMDTFMREHGKLLKSGPRRVSPFFVPMMIANMASGLIAIRYDCRGCVMPSVTACATGASAIGEAYEKIRYGQLDVVIAGGSEAAINECSVAGFTNMKALSTSEDPLAASIPFDLRRNGFVMGEGAGAVVLESYEHAVARGAKIYAELCGYGSTCDAYHIACPRPDGQESARAMSLALEQAAWSKDDVVYVNAHGTATPLGDIAETLAIKKALGEESAAAALVSSTKSMTGHMLGAAGAVEAIACIMALREGLVPPTINLLEKDPQCDLDYVPDTARKAEVTLAVSNSFGFGGHNVSLALRLPGSQNES
ncbi:MAG: beta-ketoacyl-ACP synthase II [Planctomycetia bacterium]|nr:beta-ketoacyl-ACP synthase II [Planctomycetia bacterium]